MATCREKLIAFIDSTAGAANAEQVVATDADGLIDPSFLTERVQDIVGDNLVTDTTSIVWTYTDAAGTLEADVQDEYVQDVVGAMLTDSSTIDFTYDDGAGTFTAIVPINAINDTHIDWGTGVNQVNTDDMPEGSTNLYFTDERAQDAVGGILTDSSEIDFTYSDATPSITASIVAGSIDETKLDTSVNASLDLADSSVQPGDSVTDLLPPGSDTQVIINDGGSFAGASGLTWDGWLGINTTTQFAPGSDSIAVLVDDDTSLSFGTTTTGTFTHGIRWWDGIDNVAEIEIDHSIGQFEIATTGSYILQFRTGGAIACDVDTNQDWDFKAGNLTTTGAVTASSFESTITTGSAPLVIASTTLVSNLNSDLLDGQQGSYYLSRTNHTGTQTLSTISDAGTAAAEDIGTSGDALGKLNTANTWSAVQHQSFAGNVIPVLTSTDNSAVQLRFKSDSTNRRFLAVNSADSVKSQLGFGNDEIRLAGNNYSTNLYAVFNGSGLAVTGDISATGSVGIGTASPAASAALDVTSTTKGFLPPRMTTAQRDAIASPATGLTVFNTDSGELNVYDGTAWRIISSRVVYKDMIAPVAAARLPPASAPTWDSFGPTATPQRQELAFAVGDYAIISPFHVNHDIKPGGNAYLHVHWTTNGTNTGLVKWEMSYMRAKGHDQANFGAPVTLSIEEAAAGTAWRHMITETGTAIVMTEPDELILVVLKRVSPSAGSNSDTVFGLQVDLHYEADRDGTPNKTPNFYT